MNDELIQVIEDLKMSIYEDMGAETSPNEVEQYVSALLLCLGISGRAKDLPAVMESINIYAFIDMYDYVLSAWNDRHGMEACRKLAEHSAETVNGLSWKNKFTFQVLLLENLLLLYQTNRIEIFAQYYDRLDLNILGGYIYEYPEFYVGVFSELTDVVHDRNGMRMGQMLLDLLPHIDEVADTDYVLCLANLCESATCCALYDEMSGYYERLGEYRECCYVDMAYLFLLTDLYMAQTAAEKNTHGDREKAEHLLNQIGEHISDVEDSELREELQIKYLLERSRNAIAGGDYVSALRYTEDGYSVCKSSIEAHAEYLLLFLNNMAIAFANQGDAESCKQCLDEGLSVISEYHLEESTGAAYLSNTYSRLANDAADETSKEQVRNLLGKCRPEDVSFRDIPFVLNSIKMNLRAGNAGRKEKTLILNMLEHIEKLLLQEKSNELWLSYLDVRTAYFIVVKDARQSRLWFDRMYEFSQRCFPDMEMVIDVICDNLSFVRRMFSMQELKSLLFTLVRITPMRLTELVLYQEQKSMFARMSRINLFFHIVVSFVYDGSIVCSDVELLEIFGNLKSICPDILSARRECLSDCDRKSYEELCRVERRIIELDMARYFGHETDKEQLTELDDRKRSVENKLYAKAQPKVMGWLSADELIGRLPTDCLYIDYLQFVTDYEKPTEKNMRYAVLTVVKTEQGCRIYRQPVIDAYEVRQLCNIIDKRTRGNRSYDRKQSAPGRLYDVSVSRKLYDILLRASVESCHVEPRSDRLIISGDIELQSFPFDMLTTSRGSRLLQEFNVCYVNSMRSIHHDVYVNRDEGALVIGNPQFTLDKEKVLSGENEEKKLSVLPLSKVEAQTVADFLGAGIKQKIAARKNLLEEVHVPILHIATHGDFRQDEHFDPAAGPFEYDYPMRHSCIFLAGANDWIVSGEETDHYGNGVVSAEEICTYDWDGVKMVVLSACLTNTGDISYTDGLIGMHTALCAQGISACVMSLWEVDDFAAAVLMSRFYQNLRTMEVTSALWEAKKYIMTVTNGELADAGWYGEQRIRRIGLAADEMRRLSQLPAGIRLFEKPVYWAGFVAEI